MEITVIRSGGLLGATEELGPLDSKDLPARLQGEIQEEIEKAGFFELPAELPGKPIPDGYSYGIAISEKDRSHSVTFRDVDMGGLGRLLALIEQSGAGYHRKGREPEESMKVECFDWDAWYNRMPGREDKDLHVAGTCRLPSSQVVVSLDLDRIDSETAVLRLTATAPGAVGDTRVVEVQVSWRMDVGPDIERVQIIGAAEALLDVGEKS